MSLEPLELHDFILRDEQSSNLNKKNKADNDSKNMGLFDLLNRKIFSNTLHTLTLYSYEVPICTNICLSIAYPYLVERQVNRNNIGRSVCYFLFQKAEAFML